MCIRDSLWFDPLFLVVKGMQDKQMDVLNAIKLFSDEEMCIRDSLETALASMFVVKYGSIIVMDKIGYAEALPLYGLRQNIFTDPQKPMKVAPGIYPINGATPDDPCALTVDFALTYFPVSYTHLDVYRRQE